MRSMGRRAGYLALVALVGFTVGLASRSQRTVVPQAFAAYQADENLAELTGASDLVIRGVVRDAGTPFLDFGAQSPDDEASEGDGVPMRLFSVQVSFPDSENQEREHLQVAVTDVDEIPLAGDANLAEGDDVFLFLERLENSDFGIASVTGEFFYVVVGGRQGVFKESSPGVWEQPRDPHAVLFRAEDGQTAVLSVALSELQRVATP